MQTLENGATIPHGSLGDGVEQNSGIELYPIGPILLSSSLDWDFVSWEPVIQAILLDQLCKSVRYVGLFWQKVGFQIKITMWQLDVDPQEIFPKALFITFVGLECVFNCEIEWNWSLLKANDWSSITLCCLRIFCFLLLSGIAFSCGSREKLVIFDQVFLCWIHRVWNSSLVVIRAAQVCIFWRSTVSAFMMQTSQWKLTVFWQF